MLGRWYLVCSWGVWVDGGVGIWYLGVEVWGLREIMSFYWFMVFEDFVDL